MLSIVIPTRNRAPLLRAALQSLLEQDLHQEEFEVLVVDNGSTDDTRSVADEFSQYMHGLFYFYEASPGLHSGRHRGLKEARGDVLVYADDDIRAVSTWLRAIKDCFTDPAVAMVGGNNYPDFKSHPPEWLRKLWVREDPQIGGQAITSLSVLKLADGRRVINPHWVWGCNFSIRRRILLDAGGFHPDSMPQDLIRFRGDGETHVSRYVLQAGLLCMFDSGASVYHAVTQDRMTREYFEKRAFNQGVSDSYTALRSGGCESRTRLKRVLDQGRGLVRRLLHEVGGRRAADAHEPELRKMMARGYLEGFSFHRQAYREDADVREWVHRPDYY